MALPQSPDAARSRYAASFRSSIFDPSPVPQSPAFVPAGKRRDQTTSEMFGNYDEKDLRGMPKTFVPKEDNTTARQKRILFQRSEALAGSAYYPQAGDPLSPAPCLTETRGFLLEDETGHVDTSLRRQLDLSSSMFGRPTPEVSATMVHQPNSRLVPNDFSWHSHPEPLHADSEAQVNHLERSYQQKCSDVLNYQSPQEVMGQHAAAERQLRQEEAAADLKRRANVYYSDLFGRSADFVVPEAQQDGTVLRRPRTTPNPEDRHIIHQDWMDSKTELMNSRSPRPEDARGRKADELHQARIFHQQATWQAPAKVEPVMQDNASKVRMVPGMTCKQLQQAHLRTSITPSEFYDEVENTKHWEVIELHLSGLPSNADSDMVKRLCQGFDLQIVKAVADVDPVRNLCKGRAKIMVRFNPVRDSVSGLVRKLQELNYRVEM